MPTFVRAPQAARVPRIERRNHASPARHESLKGVANAKKNCEKVQAAAEEMVGADTDAVFKSACRFIVMKSLPGWMEEICTKHLQGSSTCFPSRIRRVRNAHASVWKKAQASLDDRHQTSDQKLMLEESVEKAEAGATELKQRAPSQKSPTAALYQASVAALPLENAACAAAAATPISVHMGDDLQAHNNARQFPSQSPGLGRGKQALAPRIRRLSRSCPTR